MVKDSNVCLCCCFLTKVGRKQGLVLGSVAGRSADADNDLMGNRLSAWRHASGLEAQCSWLDHDMTLTSRLHLRQLRQPQITVCNTEPTLWTLIDAKHCRIAWINYLNIEPRYDRIIFKPKTYFKWEIRNLHICVLHSLSLIGS